jgi:hypothetical protein
MRPNLRLSQTGVSEMGRMTVTDQIEALRQQQERIAAKLKDAEAAQRQKLKANEGRRHELAGRAVLAVIAKEPESPLARSLLDVLRAALRRPVDVELFPELAGVASPAPASAVLPPTALVNGAAAPPATGETGHT